MAVRRSARLRSQGTPDSDESTPQPVAPSQLPSVEENDEAPSNDQPAVRTPVTKKTTQKRIFTNSHQESKEARTPTSASAVRPSANEMHPSKAHQSTTKKVDSGLILGFNPIKKDAAGNVLKEGAVEKTPSKTKPSPAPSQFGTPGYEFKFGQESDLSNAAQQLMETIRQEARQARANMEPTEAEQQKRDLRAPIERKIAKARGQAGRFSDVHMAEFKKMDSIANHPSSFRAAPGRFEPATKSLKRTKSKAQLDEPEPQNESPSRSSSSAKPSAVPVPTATAKRVKRNAADDTTASRSNVEGAEKKEDAAPKPVAPRARPRSAVRSSLMTPTRSSMARTSSISLSLKAPKTSLIPSLARSPSTQALASPRTPRTEFNPRFKTNLPTFNNLKSILRRRQPLFSRNPAKIAAGTHTAAPDFNPDLLFAGQNDQNDAAPSPSPKKHVEFTPSVKSRHGVAEASPSPSKVPTTPSRSKLSEIVYPTLPTLTPDHKSATEASTTPTGSPSIRHVRSSEVGKLEPTWPELPVVAHGVSHGLSNKKRRREDFDDDDVPNAEDAENVPPSDAQSDERGTKRLKANPPTPSPIKSRPMKTPNRSVSSNRFGTPASTKQKRPGMLSLSRLNMLAKPKGQA
ncbi:uncharacterized protein N7484_009795 [Penicillium longicatenatum]|uniref:uncharacterized protein n=1 Tax=Penicillium longicatenatum TaxID=1561947 RepID=UPI0025467CDB|nr:uncharacterized protein N7484_009795 [Penicillium longicatenatum]KAJ5636482.1 hypothetical protein N7484_009795 [Penicillium longicatenatum]